MSRTVLCVVLVLAGLPAMAQTVHDRLTVAMAGWLDTQNTQGVIDTAAMGDDGGFSFGREGQATADIRVELASVGKSVTATCALTLVEAGKLAWSDRLPDLLSMAPDVTVAELVTHTSGLGPDSTQDAMPEWLDATTAASVHRADDVLGAVNARATQSGTRGTYGYNNENYALLGLVIEAASGQSYLQYCTRALDLSGEVMASPRSGAYQPWGGLHATPTGFARFLVAQFGPESGPGQDPFAYPHIEIGGGAYYGLGMVFREFGNGFNFWHFGALCISDQLNVGSYAVIWEGQVAALAAYEGCKDWDAMVALDGALARAVYGRGQ
ncbi:unnamed protein product [Chrysoparadoxa australica]